MGTAITLSLNGIEIDWGKNRYWKRHHWLFPPGSLTEIEYRYADGAVETKPGFVTTLNETRFRLCHLGYSHQETKAKFDAAVTHWNRTADLGLSFDEFRSALTGVDFATLTQCHLERYGWDFRAFVLNRLSAWDTNEALLEDFIHELDFTLTLRVLADPVENRRLALRWNHHDLIESGWASLDDLIEIDRPTFMANHTMLFGRLQDHAGAKTAPAFDNWLAGRGLQRATAYTRVRPNGSVTPETTTLPTAVRNMIHHPENPHNALSDQDLRDSVELLLRVAQGLPTPLSGPTQL